MLVLYHIPCFRSSRVLHMELELVPSGSLPAASHALEWRDVAHFRNKPDWYLTLNGKVPVLDGGSVGQLCGEQLPGRL